MFKQLMIFIQNLQCVTSDEIFFYFLEKDSPVYKFLRKTKKVLILSQ